MFFYNASFLLANHIISEINKFIGSFIWNGSILRTKSNSIYFSYKMGETIKYRIAGWSPIIE